MYSYLVNQYKHMSWANRKLIACLKQDGVALAEALDLMSHIVSAEHVWLSRIRGQAEILTPWSKLTLPECEDYAEANGGGYLDIVLQLSEKRLHEPICFKLTNGTPMSTPLEDILCHVPLHGAHHRGQIARIIAQNDIKPPAVDYIIYSMQTER